MLRISCFSYRDTLSEHRESSYLRAYKAPGNCQLSSVNCPRSCTSVENALQISPFMQNKPNFQKVKLNVNKVLTEDYGKRTLGQRGKNKPNSKPIKANFPAPRGETNPIQTQTNPIKPNFKRGTYAALRSVAQSYRLLMEDEFRGPSRPLPCRHRPTPARL